MPKYRGYPSWSNRKFVEGSHKQNAWDDTSDYEVPVIVIPGASVEDALRDAAEIFRKSEAAQPESGWGRLRWSGGCSIVALDPIKQVLVVRESIRLCD